MTLPSFTMVAFSGSLRAGSANTGLVRMAIRVAPPSLVISVHDVAALPFYNPDLESDVPDVVVQWRDAVTAADAILIALPEYNFGPSGVAKNALDWLSRPPQTRALQGKVIALLTAGGKGGGSRVQASIGPILGLLGNTVVEEPVVQVAMGSERISADGTTTDPAIEELVRAKLDATLEALAALSAS